MNKLDRLLQFWRIRVASKSILPGSTVLDIGCHKGELFMYLDSDLGTGIGIDPGLEEEVIMGRYSLYPGIFPDDMTSTDRFDVITVLATLEHIPEQRLSSFVKSCFFYLKRGGLIIITVPSILTYRLLPVLKAIGIIEGMSLDELTMLKPGDVPGLFPTEQFQVVTIKQFQVRFNNLIVLSRL